MNCRRISAAINAWIFLAIAIALELAGTFLLKLSNGFEKWQWGMLSIGCYSDLSR